MSQVRNLNQSQANLIIELKNEKQMLLKQLEDTIVEMSLKHSNETRELEDRIQISFDRFSSKDGTTSQLIKDLMNQVKTLKQDICQMQSDLDF